VIAPENSTLELTTLIGNNVTLGGVLIDDNVRFNIDSQSTGVAITNLTLGEESRLVFAETVWDEVANPEANIVTVTVSGKLTIGDGDSYLGDWETDDEITNLTLADGSTIDWILGPGEMNFVDVAGNLLLGENLTINLIDGGGSAAGEDVILFVTAQFYNEDDPDDEENIDIPTMITINAPVDSGWTFGDLEHLEDTIILKNLTATSVVLFEGDANGDKVVDIDDLNIFKAQFGGEWNSVVNEDPDFNNDGLVTLADFAILRANWGGSSSAPTAPSDLSATPEPATMTVLVFGGLLVLKRRRRRS
jgi:hypothetical protein